LERQKIVNDIALLGSHHGFFLGDHCLSGMDMLTTIGTLIGRLIHQPPVIPVKRVQGGPATSGYRLLKYADHP
jgi:hypothetical protein